MQKEVVMATLILCDGGFAAHRPSPLDALRQRWQHWRRQRADRAALVRAGSLGSRLLADMGLEEEAVRPVVGGWDALRPNGFLVRRRR
jgi:uncharacterized protein YjiS (DUF1127 family)